VPAFSRALLQLWAGEVKNELRMARARYRSGKAWRSRNGGSQTWPVRLSCRKGLSASGTHQAQGVGVKPDPLVNRSGRKHHRPECIEVAIVIFFSQARQTLGECRHGE